MKTLCSVIPFPSCMKRLQFYIILQICAKNSILDGTLICLSGYWLLIWFNNLLIGHIMIIGSEWSCFERPIVEYRVLPDLFTKSVCATNTFAHGWLVMTLCCNKKIWSFKTYFGKFDIYQISFSVPYLRFYINFSSIFVSSFVV